MVITNISIEFLLFIIIIVVLTLIYLYIYLITKQLQEAKLKKRKIYYVRSKQTEWNRYLLSDSCISDTLIPKKRFEFQGIEEIFLSYIQHFTDTTVQKKIKQFSNEYLANHYAELLKSKNTSNRILALKRIFDFQMNHLLENCQRLENQKLSKEERFQLMKIYSLFNPHLFLKKLVEDTELTNYEFKQLLLNIDDAVMQQLINQQNNLDIRKQYALIDTIGLKRNLDSLLFLEKSLKNEDLEIRIRSLKAINKIGIIEDLKEYTPFVTSLYWEERLMVGKLLKYAPSIQTRPYLEQLIHDQSWWVRNQAAKTLIDSKNGTDILQQIILTSTDSHAVDAAKEVLHSRG